MAELHVLPKRLRPTARAVRGYLAIEAQRRLGVVILSRKDADGIGVLLRTCWLALPVYLTCKSDPSTRNDHCRCKRDRQ